MMKIIKKITILFWKAVAIIWDLRPRMCLPKYKDFPIARTNIADEYLYPKGTKVLYEWDEKDYHWIVFSR